jgi:hypothetical protein
LITPWWDNHSHKGLEKRKKKKKEKKEREVKINK